MAKKYEAPRQSGNLRRALDFKLSKIYRRHSFSTSADKLSTETCGHHKPIVRNVTTAGAAAYICRGCYRYLLSVEFKAIARRQFEALFNLLPRIERSGALEVAI